MDKKNHEKKIFNRAEQLSIIQEYLTTKQTASELARKYGSSNPSFIVSWINRFNLEIKDCPIIDKKKLNSDISSNLKSIEKLRKMPIKEISDETFTIPQKIKILKEYLSKEISLIEICRKHNIKWRSSISRWKISIEKYLLRKHQTNKKLDYSNQELLDLIMASKRVKKARKFSKEIKDSIIKEYYATRITKAYLARKYNIGSSQMSSWILNHEAKEGIIGKKIEINKEQKYKIIEDYVLSDLSQSQIQKKYGIKSRASILTWKGKIEKELKVKEKNLSKEEKELLSKIVLQKGKTPRFHSKKLKASILYEYKTTEITKAELSRKYDIAKSSITEWTTSKKQKEDKISNNKIESDKLALKEIILKNNRIISDTMHKRGKKTLQEENKILKEELQKLEKEKISREKLKDNKILKLKEQISELEAEHYKKTKELENEKFKRICYDTLIDVAEKELKIEIRKKYEVKQ